MILLLVADELNNVKYSKYTTAKCIQTCLLTIFHHNGMLCSVFLTSTIFSLNEPKQSNVCVKLIIMRCGPAGLTLEEKMPHTKHGTTHQATHD